ncbi:dTDP-4-dehydrorhamnose 3,5-epimerase [Paenibacillus sp. N1-5-1-14]|uniref:dTDP-4-dehydrorhamnose 3,5-epimerase n=1 Tax=Paenibacillus radicibacter TaxID=2972488 RepID=UPI002159309E|nr:dTDP-4-dehydrorhamnose 3,5-epimerase [Paenibacillus radicibacter]MCR8643613.1 dTDP-4-dehydrorhamnose 3,5-epimerase [Paenibacillus radicibacter]
MRVVQTGLEGVVWIEPAVYGDHRGYFMESYNEANFAKHGISHTFIQDNQSLSAQAGVIRGLHFQLAPKAQTKLIRVLSGAIYDVAVDIRPDSNTFGKWVGVILSASNKRQLLIPKGFAHGFCTITPNVEVLYKVDEYYSPEHDRGILWNDPLLAIDWPASNPVLSDKDAKLPLLSEIQL